jgi:hypothetical protein
LGANFLTRLSAFAAGTQPAARDKAVSKQFKIQRILQAFWPVPTALDKTPSDL